MATEPESANQCGHCVRQKENFSPIWRPFLAAVSGGDESGQPCQDPLSNPLFGVYWASWQDTPQRISDFLKDPRVIAARDSFGIVFGTLDSGVHEWTELLIAHAAQPAFWRGRVTLALQEAGPLEESQAQRGLSASEIEYVRLSHVFHRSAPDVPTAETVRSQAITASIHADAPDWSELLDGTAVEPGSVDDRRDPRSLFMRAWRRSSAPLAKEAPLTIADPGAVGGIVGMIELAQHPQDVIRVAASVIYHTVTRKPFNSGNLGAALVIGTAILRAHGFDTTQTGEQITGLLKSIDAKQLDQEEAESRIRGSFVPSEPHGKPRDVELQPEDVDWAIVRWKGALELLA
jgi:hypothetical protein